MAPSCFAFISEFSMNFSRGLLTVGLHLIGGPLVYTFNFNGVLRRVERLDWRPGQQRWLTELRNTNGTGHQLTVGSLD